MLIAIDFDGTCVTHEYPKVGRDVGAYPVLKKMCQDGHKLMLWTMRSGETLKDAIDWFVERDIELSAVNICHTQGQWTESPKLFANIYIDDAALGAPLRAGLPGERPYIDWVLVSTMMGYD